MRETLIGFDNSNTTDAPGYGRRTRQPILKDDLLREIRAAAYPEDQCDLEKRCSAAPR
jgi:hypothetical protein